MQKCGRNDPCLCGSGKKFKKCCEGKSPIKRFQIERLQPQITQASLGLTALFQSRLSSLPLKITPPPIDEVSSDQTTSLEEKPKDLLP